ncbi:MAG TPA: NAD(P)/FAD-dependent oxidoreductase [Terriglobia bacterium]|nr:NAD(P)/FAD-dependent oxidoreductase [Terriglobia bacterium]
MEHTHRVVIIGAGFGGLWAARALTHSSLHVTLIDRNNYHTFLPLLYQVAAAEVEPEEIVYPVRSILRGFPNVGFLMAEVHDIDFERHVVETNATTVPYDFLIVAAGSNTNFFGVQGVERAFPLKSLDEAVRLRNHILCCFERAALLSDPEDRRKALSFAIVGGGATGVEFAGALAELLRGPLRKDYSKLGLEDSKVVLLEAASGLLRGLPKSLGDYALKRLRRMGVEVRLNAAVRRIESDAVNLMDDTLIPAETVVWTAGVRGEPSAEAWGLPVNGSGRVPIEPTLQLSGHSEVYIVGDLARFEQDGQTLPMVAPVAMQQATTAARNILRQSSGQALKPFRFHDPGMMATIGRNAAVAHFYGLNITGFPAWVAWLGVHIVKIIGFRNRIMVLTNWAWDYFLYERAVRLILPTASCREPARIPEVRLMIDD